MSRAMIPAREIPVEAHVDMILVGGTVAGVAAAVAAAERGQRAVLVTDRSYLGEDLCATLRLWRREVGPDAGPLVRAIFGGGCDEALLPPVRVKRVLTEALLAAGVEFLFLSHPVGVLRDAAGVAGLAVANRNGTQAILGRTILDTTDRAVAARLAGAAALGEVSGTCTVERVILAAAETDPPGTAVASTPFTVAGRRAAAHRCRWSVPAERTVERVTVDGAARETAYVEGQWRGAERLFAAWPAQVPGCAGEPAASATSATIDHCRPLGTDEGVFVVGPCSDVAREAVEAFMEPDVQETLGRRIGEHVAGREPAPIAHPSLPAVAAPAEGDVIGDLADACAPWRPFAPAEQMVRGEAGTMPVAASFDVVVAGGGTSGVAAAIAAGRAGARVLVIEPTEALGGLGTVGMISNPYHGRDIGFAAEIPWAGPGCTNDDKAQWFLRELTAAGGVAWFGSCVTGVLRRGERVTGVLAATPDGPRAVAASVVIDATGNADLAFAAGAACMYATDANDLALQGVGLGSRPLGVNKSNTDYLLTDECDLVDIRASLAGATLAMEDERFDVVTLVQSRERRRVVGDHVMTWLDQIRGRTYDDAVVCSMSDYDAHGYASGDYFALIPHDQETRRRNHPAPARICYTPYRSLLPKGLDGLFVLGLGTSMERDAVAMMRMQRDLANQGYAAGTAAAMAAKDGLPLREVDVKALQAHLVDKDCLPPDVLEPSAEEPGALERAVGDLTRDHTLFREEVARALAVVLQAGADAITPLETAYRRASGSKRLYLARILGTLGSAAGAEELLAALQGVETWDEKIFQGHMAEYAHLPTPVDSLLLALARCGDGRLRPHLRRLAERLTDDHTLSHYRAVAGAAVALGGDESVDLLAVILARDGMTGHALHAIVPLHDKPVHRRRRTPAFREITLARALYRCGDTPDRLGESILRDYTIDLRGLLARHARAVLGREA
ncbi:MAG: FAD-dependent oxidoreductase [Planctomycetota bacterium]